MAKSLHLNIDDFINKYEAYAISTTVNATDLVLTTSSLEEFGAREKNRRKEGLMSPTTKRVYDKKSLPKYNRYL